MSLGQAALPPASFGVVLLGSLTIYVYPVIHGIGSAMLPSVLPRKDSVFSLIVTFFASAKMVPCPTVLIKSDREHVRWHFSPRVSALLASRVIYDYSFAIGSTVSLDSGERQLSL